MAGSHTIVITMGPAPIVTQDISGFDCASAVIAASSGELVHQDGARV
jgi:hypothetical protein